MTFKESVIEWWEKRRLIVWPLVVAHAAAYAFMAGLLLGYFLR